MRTRGDALHLAEIIPVLSGRLVQLGFPLRRPGSKVLAKHTPVHDSMILHKKLFIVKHLRNI